MSTNAIDRTTAANVKTPLKTMPAPSGGQMRRPMRRRLANPKVAVMSPEAREAARLIEVKLIQDFLNTKAITQCPDRWAHGAYPSSQFGGGGSSES